jgi:hypothetical protein
MAENKDFGHALKRGKIARNRRDLRASRQGVYGHSPSLALSVQFCPFRGVTPTAMTMTSARRKEDEYLSFALAEAW